MCMKIACSNVCKKHGMKRERKRVREREIKIEVKQSKAMRKEITKME